MNNHGFLSYKNEGQMAGNIFPMNQQLATVLPQRHLLPKGQICSPRANRTVRGQKMRCTQATCARVLHRGQKLTVKGPIKVIIIIIIIIIIVSFWQSTLLPKDHLISWKKKVAFSMAIGNLELMHESFPKHFSKGTARMK